MKALKGPDPRDDVKAREERAKDVAAFANASGGCLLIGAEERGFELIQYNEVAREKAEEIATSYFTAIQKHCSPVPVIDTQVLEHGNGFVIAVNVSPYPAPPIGVRPSDGKDLWSFPMRVADKTRHLVPEQLATLMDAVFRRKVLQLERIPQLGETGMRDVIVHFVDVPEQRSVAVEQLWLNRGGRVYSPQRLRVTSIDPIGGTFSGVGTDDRAVVIPLDAITSTWKDAAENAHQVAISGVLVRDNRGVRYLPG